MTIPHGTQSGYSYHKCKCDICVSAKKERDAAYYLANKDKVKAKVAAYNAKNSDKVKAAQKKYREENVDKIKAAKAQYAKDNSKAIVAKVAKWRQENPERSKALQAKYRETNREELNQKSRERYHNIMATNPERIRKLRRDYAKTPHGRLIYRNAQELRRRNTPYTEESLAWIESIDWSTELCTYCPNPATEIDHIIPISAGGTGDRINLTPICRTCNAGKGNRCLAEFLGFVDPERNVYA